MPFDVGSVVAHVEADIGDFKNKMNEAKGIADGFKDKLGGVGQAMGAVAKQSALLAGVVGGALVMGAKSSIDAFNDAEKIMKQTEAVLISTKGKAGMTADSILELASSLESLTTYSDDEIQSGQNMLLTFTSIGKDVFPAATKTMLDMSAALGQDLKGSAIQLGKALNDPIQGMTALRRVGVSFTEDQKSQIAALQSSGKLMEAQKLILKELATEFGGSAAKQAETFSGKLQQMKNYINNLQENIGWFLVNALTPMFSAINNFVTSEAFEQWIYRLEGAFKALYEAIVNGNFTVLFKNIFHQDEDSPLFQMLMKLHEAFVAFGGWIAANKDLVITFLQGLGVALGVLLVIGTITLLIGALMNPLVLVALAIAALFTAWQTNFLGIRDITQAVVNFVWPIIQWFWNVISNAFKLGAALIKGDWGAAWEAIKNLGKAGWDAVVALFNAGLKLLGNIGGAIFDTLTKPFRDAWNTISDLVNKIKDAMDFTKRHSPSVMDIMNRSVDLANSALQRLDFSPVIQAQSIPANLAPENIMPTSSPQVHTTVYANVADGLSVDMLAGQLAFRLRNEL